MVKVLFIQLLIAIFGQFLSQFFAIFGQINMLVHCIPRTDNEFMHETRRRLVQ